MNAFQQNDLYYDSNPQRSPRSNQYSTQSLHRQQSRHFDPFGQTFGLDESASRYDSNRYSDRMNANMQNNYAGFEMGPPPAWNSPAYGHNSLAGIGATTRVRPPATRGRIPSVRFLLMCLWACFSIPTNLGRAGWINPSIFRCLLALRLSVPPQSVYLRPVKSQ